LVGRDVLQLDKEALLVFGEGFIKSIYDSSLLGSLGVVSHDRLMLKYI